MVLGNGLGEVMNHLKQIASFLRQRSRNTAFLESLEWFEGFISKILSIAMIILIIAILIDLIQFLIHGLWSGSNFLGATLTEMFGAFLSVLIALELLENITAYLQKQYFQIELVIVTSLIAVARKLVILELDKVEGIELIGLSLSILALSISYWIVRKTNDLNDTPLDK